ALHDGHVTVVRRVSWRRFGAHESLAASRQPLPGSPRAPGTVGSVCRLLLPLPHPPEFRAVATISLRGIVTISSRWFYRRTIVTTSRPYCRDVVTTSPENRAVLQRMKQHQTPN